MSTLPGRSRAWLSRHRRGATMSAQVLALAVVVWFLVVPQLHGSMPSLSVLLRNGSPWIMAALVAELASLGCSAVVTRAMLPGRTRPSMKRVVGIDLSAIALGHCLPDGGAAGTALSWRLLVAEGVPPAEATFAKMAQGLGSTIVLQTLLLASFAVGTAMTGFSRWEVLPAAAAAVILVFVALAVFGVGRIGLRRWLGRAVRRLPWFGPRLGDLLGGIYRRHLVEQLRAILRDRRTIRWAVLCAAANWGFDALALWASIRAFGPSVGLLALAVVYGVQALAAWLPITPSGLGVSEAVMIPALVAFGSAHGAVVLGLLTWRVIAYWLPIPIGAVAFGVLRLSRRAAPSVPILPAVRIVKPRDPVTTEMSPALAPTAPASPGVQRQYL